MEPFRPWTTPPQDSAGGEKKKETSKQEVYKRGSSETSGHPRVITFPFTVGSCLSFRPGVHQILKIKTLSFLARGILTLVKFGIQLREKKNKELHVGFAPLRFDFKHFPFQMSVQQNHKNIRQEKDYVSGMEQGMRRVCAVTVTHTQTKTSLGPRTQLLHLESPSARLVVT